MNHRIVADKLDGTPYTVHTLYVGTQVVWSQLGPMSDAEIASRVAAFLAPPAPPRPFVLRDRGKLGPKGKGASPAWSKPKPGHFSIKPQDDDE